MSDQCDKNLMPVYNLAPLWGPNMVTVESGDTGGVTDFGQTRGEMKVFQAVGNVSTMVCTVTQGVPDIMTLITLSL